MTSRADAPRRTYGGVPAHVRTARRREQFLAAGLDVFGTTGYRSATVRGLCRAAGVTDRYFYESFPSTEALLAAVYADAMSRISTAITGELTALPPEASPEQAVRACLDAYFRAVEDPRMLRVCWVEIHGVGPLADEAYRTSVDEFAAMIVELARTVAPEWIPADPRLAHSVAVGLVGAVSQLSLAWSTGDSDLGREELVEAAARIFLGVGVVAADD